MAFQNNSGDIILDVVLTDEGRRRLAMGNGSFSIQKFALTDDEINYSLFNTQQPTALQDLSILQTPVLEAFTNNASSMKSKLLTLSSQDHLYLPIIKLNEVSSKTKTHTDGNFVVCVDQNTTDDRPFSRTDSIAYNNNVEREGFIHGVSNGPEGSFIKIDAGIDTTAATDIVTGLEENEFQIEIDSRLGSIIDINGTTPIQPVAIDDDSVATYILTLDPGSPFVRNPNQEDLLASSSPIDGPISTTLEFKIRSSMNLRDSDFLFNKIGSTAAYAKRAGGGNTTTKVIDSIVRVTGLTTGYAIDIPVRFAKI
jgi:hypothetical protein